MFLLIQKAPFQNLLARAHPLIHAPPGPYISTDLNFLTSLAHTSHWPIDALDYPLLLCLSLTTRSFISLLAWRFNSRAAPTHAPPSQPRSNRVQSPIVSLLAPVLNDPMGPLCWMNPLLQPKGKRCFVKNTSSAQFSFIFLFLACNPRCARASAVHTSANWFNGTNWFFIPTLRAWQKPQCRAIR